MDKEMNDLVADYGYFNAFPDGSKVGRSSNAVKYMAILPKRGKKQALIDAAARVGVLLKSDRKKFADGKEHECLTVPALHQIDFVNRVREVVKGHKK